MNLHQDNGQVDGDEHFYEQEDIPSNESNDQPQPPSWSSLAAFLLIYANPELSEFRDRMVISEHHLVRTVARDFHVNDTDSESDMPLLDPASPPAGPIHGFNRPETHGEVPVSVSDSVALREGNMTQPLSLRMTLILLLT